MTNAVPAPDWDRLLRRVAGWFSIARLTAAREDELCAFMIAAYRDQPAAGAFAVDEQARRRMRWITDRNPVAFDDGRPAWLCLKDGRIVGHIGAMAADAVVDGRVVPICWGRDLIVAPEARRLGAGPLLVMTAVREVARPFLVAGLNDDAHALYRQLGFHENGVIPVLINVRNLARLLETMPWPRLKRHAAALALTVAQCVANRPRRRGRALTITPIERFDEEFDRWWAGVESTFGCVVRRTAATLAWRYQEHPSHAYGCYAARDERSLRGVIVVRHGRSRGLPAGFVSEFLVHPEDRAAADSLLSHAVEALSVSGADAPVFLRCTALNGAYEAALSRHGFRRAPSPLRWMSMHRDGVAALGPLAERERWLLTAGDGDLDMS